MKKIDQMIKTAQGEIELFNQAVEGEKLGQEWLDCLSQGLRDQDSKYRPLAKRPLVESLVEMISRPLIPQIDNFTPPKRTPWGGMLISKMKSSLGVRGNTVVGESWEISGHPAFPNVFPLKYADHDLRVPLVVLGKISPDGLYGALHARRFRGRMPFLAKLINSASGLGHRQKLGGILEALEKRLSAEDLSALKETLRVDSLPQLMERNNDQLMRGMGLIIKSLKKAAVVADIFKRLSSLRTQMLVGNLSIQIHPPEGYAGLEEGEQAKTEAWYVIDSEPGAGIYLGLKDRATEAQMRRRLEGGRDISDLLNFIEVRRGEVYFIPAGTPHAIGAGLLLYEPQQTSETTYRYYDWGRVDKKGKHRQLHVQEALAVTAWDAPRGSRFVEWVRRIPGVVGSESTSQAKEESLVHEREFALHRLTFSHSGDAFGGDSGNGIQGLTVIEGVVDIECSGQNVDVLHAGQSAIIPAAVGKYGLISRTDRSVVLQTSVPVT